MLETLPGSNVPPFARPRAGATPSQKPGLLALAPLESMSDALFTFDDDWTLTYLNPQTATALGEAPERLVGLNYWDVFPAAAGTKFETEYRRALRDQVTVEFEEFYGPLETWFSVRAYPMPSGLAVYFQDITSRVMLEAQLRQAQKLEAVGRLAGGIAHDFNNLLTVITGYTSLALSNLETDPSFVADALDEIQAASQRAATLTAQLLAFSRKTPLQSSVADANEIVATSLDLVQPLVEDHITIHRTLDPACGNIRVEVSLIEQVIVNLATNARDAVPAGGNLFVVTENVDLDSTSATKLAPGRYVRMTLGDDGSGMDERTRSQIFDPFFTTKPVGSGTGLGLSTAYGTITQVGGHIDVASKLGAGTTFTIHLPCTDEPLTVPHETTLPADDRGGGERVLLVEDDDAVRHLLVDVLESLGYDTVSAVSPDDALALCDGARFDLMVTDLVMPGGYGTTLAEQVAVYQPNIRVLFISGYAPESIVDLDVDGSATAFLAKPFSTASLGRHMRELLARDCDGT
jgi:PAS domain S-box-containing protein